MINSSTIEVHNIRSLSEVDAHAWNALFAANKSGQYPFVSHAFLYALEQHDCTTKNSGWEPAHIVVTDHNELIGAFIFYKKTHSYGEYVFDWSWADAYHHAGREYYPKLVSAIPFTPATGPRYALAAHLNEPEQAAVLNHLNTFIQTYCQNESISSAHLLFPTSQQLHSFKHLKNSLWMLRRGCQFHWFNQGYADFDDFLSRFSSRKRKNIKKERAKLADKNTTFTFKEAGEISSREWDDFFQLYHLTYLKRSGKYGYLTLEFFKSLSTVLPKQVVMCQVTLAQNDEHMIAAALYFKDDTTLYGRYWGASEEIDGLHFEACYYQGIEYAIEHKLQRFDPGAQGEHKIQRGFTPVETASAHFIAQDDFRAAIGQFLKQEAQHIDEYNRDARTYLPFKEGEPLVPPQVLTKLE